jgi:hypothetical protein
MATNKLYAKIEVKLSAWDKAGIYAGAMWRAALGRPYIEWLQAEIKKRCKVSMNG